MLEARLSQLLPKKSPNHQTRYSAPRPTRHEPSNTSVPADARRTAPTTTSINHSQGRGLSGNPDARKCTLFKRYSKSSCYLLRQPLSGIQSLLFPNIFIFKKQSSHTFLNNQSAGLSIMNLNINRRSVSTNTQRK